MTTYRSKEDLSREIATIRKNIVAISGKVKDSGLRCLLDRYIRFASPAMCNNGLPRTVRPHPQDKERSQIGGMGNLLCFHIGNTLTAYYEVVQNQEDPKAWARLANRSQHLTNIAEYGPNSYYSEGSDSTGYRLTRLPG